MPLAKIIYVAITFGLCYVFFWLLFLVIAAYFSNPTLFTISTYISLVISVILTIPLALAERLLKKRCSSWEYSDFCRLRKIAMILTFISVFGLAAFFVSSLFYEILPLWSLFLFLGFLLMITYSVLFWDFFSLLGITALRLKSFLRDYEKISDETDFQKLLSGAKGISAIAELYNMRIAVYNLALGLSISIVENKEKTKDDINKLIDWIENPTKKQLFSEFRRIVKENSESAENLAKEGIKEKTHWTFERAIEIYRVIVVPITVSIIAYIIAPRILEMV